MREKSKSGDATPGGHELETQVTPAAAPSSAAAPAGNGKPAARANHFGPYRILIVDDHPVVRRGVRAILDGQPGLHVCAEAADGDTALDLVKKDKPDLVVLDLTLPNKNGLDVTVTVREQFPETEVLVLTMHFSDELA